MNYLDIAIKAAKEAGKIHKKYYTAEFQVGSKGTYNNKVTTADLESEKKIIEIIKESFPDHDFLAEENEYKKLNSEYLWIIDPLDGTNNFSHRMPIFSVSIALAKNNQVILGVVYDSLRDELFTAELNKGAFLNGKKIHVSAASEIKDSMLVTGFYYDRGQAMLDTLENIKKFLLMNCVDVKRLGSAALDLCYVGCGRLDGFWEHFLHPWDFAAGKLIIEEAGGTVTGKTGNKLEIKPGYIVSSNGKIHQKMLDVINDH